MTEATRKYWAEEIPKMTDAELKHEYVALTDNDHGDVAAMVADALKARGINRLDNEIADACVAALVDRGGIDWDDTASIMGLK